MHRLKATRAHIQRPIHRGTNEWQATPAAAAVAALNPDELASWEERGFIVLRKYLSEVEVDAIEKPLLRKQASPGSPTQAGGTRHNYPDQNYLAEAPGLAKAAFGHPRILAAAEAALGHPAEIMQFGALLTLSGDHGTAGTDESPGAGTHYDYRPQRVVGSSLHFCFLIIPFSEYTDQSGPIVMCPKSHKQTKVLPSSDGRVHPVDCAQVPAARHVELINPCLKRGDVAIMHGFCWHHAMPMMAGNTQPRHGLYMKLRAADSPPACGPLLLPTAARLALPKQQRHVIPYHRKDGTQIVEHTRIIIEDSATGWILVRQVDLSDKPSLELPGCATGLSADNYQEGVGGWDSGNVIAVATRHAASLLGDTQPLPWASFVADEKTETADGKERICRIYGHILISNSVNKMTVEHSDHLQWMNPAELVTSSAERWVCGGREREWVVQWIESRDASGQRVQRGYGIASGEAGAFLVHNNQGPTGNQPGQYFFADWSKGNPMRRPPPQDWTGAAGRDLPVTDAALLPKLSENDCD